MQTSRIEVLNQKIDALSFDEVISAVSHAIQRKKKLLLFAMNVHILLQLHKVSEFKEKHSSANIIFADGVPLQWFAVFEGKKLRGRVSGTDLCESILSNQDKKSQLRVYVIASRNSLLVKLKEKYPLTFVGGYVPPFKEEWGKAIHDEMRAEVAQTKANILLVGVGPLKQEIWLLDNFHKMSGVHVGMGVGSALEILTGEMPRAPWLLKDTGLEWLWRVILEPKRLLFRYFSDFTQLVRILLS